MSSSCANPKEGAAKAASLYSEVPVINAGDGGHMHPTQTLADLTTIQRYRGAIDGVSIGLCGDLKNGRTVHSLIKALAKFDDVKFYLISPRELAIPDYMRSFMQERGLWFREVTGLEPVLPRLDVLYMTRIQRERFSDPLAYERNKGVYVLTQRKLARGEAGYDDPPPPAPGGRDRPGRGRRPPRPVLRAGSVRHVRPHGPADGLGLPAPPPAGAGGPSAPISSAATPTASP